MSDYIPYGRQAINEDDIAAVASVLNSDFLTQGPMVPKFERSLIDYCHSTYAVAVNSATSALHIACLALDVTEGDRVWTSPITFVASANAARYCGAVIDFVDIDPDTFNLCPEKLEAKLLEAKNSNLLPKVVIPVHMCGQSCDMAKIYELSQRFGFKIIEDASHAVGGDYEDKPVGGCAYSDICVFSFHPVKIITTGEGGVAMTNQPKLADKMDLLRSHGITRDRQKLISKAQSEWYYEQQDLGFNYRMTDIHAALGLSQMDRLNSFVSKRRQLAKRYDARLATLEIELPVEKLDSKSSFHLYVIRLSDSLVDRHASIFSSLRDQGLGVNLHYMPVYLQPYYRDLGFKPGLCPNAENYYSRAISIPLFPTMSHSIQNRVIEVLDEVLEL